MAKEKIISKVIYQTKNGMDIKRTNYEKHIEFSAKFKFETGDTIATEVIPENHQSKLRFIWNKNKHGSLIVDEVIYHIDPMSIFNQLSIIERHVDKDKNKPLYGLMIMYKGDERDDKPRLITVTEVEMSKDKKIYLCDRFDDIPEDIFVNVTSYMNLPTGVFNKENTKRLTEALNNVYGSY